VREVSAFDDGIAAGEEVHGVGCAGAVADDADEFFEAGIEEECESVPGDAGFLSG